MIRSPQNPILTIKAPIVKSCSLPGQKVSVRILSVDVVAGKMMLTMKGEKKTADYNVTGFLFRTRVL